MSNTQPTELERFYRFVRDQIENGGADLAPEEVLDLFRAHHPTAEELADSVQAVKEALADMHAGDRGQPAQEVLHELRARH